MCEVQSSRWRTVSSLEWKEIFVFDSCSFLFHYIAHPYWNWGWLVTGPWGVCKSGQNTAIKLLSFPSDTHVPAHTQHTSLDFLCFAASRKKHPDVSSSPTTLPEYRGALWCRKATPNSFCSTSGRHTHTHPYTCISPHPVALHVQLSRHGSLGQTISLHLWGMKCHEEGEREAKLSSEIISFCLLMCFLRLLLLLLPSSSCYRKNTWQ